MEPVSVEQIAITPGTCGGRPRIAGTRIRVQDVVLWVESMGMSPEEIVSNYPHLTREDIEAALSYYRSHVDEIQASLRATEELVQTLEKEQPSILHAIAARRHVGS